MYDDLNPRRTDLHIRVGSLRENEAKFTINMSFFLCKIRLTVDLDN